jgi:uncharacterized protein (TIGR04141 family)
MKGSNPTNKITLYLLKSNEEHSEYLENVDKLQKRQLDKTSEFYYVPSKNFLPKWVQGFFGSQISDIENSFYSAFASAVLIKKISRKGQNYAFAITFGQCGWQLLKKGSWEERFGLITALNFVNDSTIRSIDKSNMGVLPKSSREQGVSLGSITDYGVDTEQDLIRSITGRCLDKETGTTISGKDSLHISAKVNIKTIDTLLVNILNIYKSEAYKEKFPWIDNIIPLTDKTKIERLNDLLIQKVLSEDVTHNIWMAVPEVINWTGINGFCYMGDRGTLIDDLSIVNLKESFVKKNKTISVDGLKKQKIESIDTDGNRVGYSWSAYNCIYAEIIDEETQLILNNGEWFSVEKVFKDTVEDEYKEILSDEELPEYTAIEDEATYNERFAKEKGLTLMDAKNITHGGGHSKIEFCDVYDYANKRLYHIKRYGNSSTLSHLFNQGLVSAESIFQDKDFRNKVNEKLPNAENFDPVENRPNASEFEITFGVISKSNNKLEIPFFSKVALKNISRTLHGFGVKKVSLIKIKWKTESDNGK